MIELGYRWRWFALVALLVAEAMNLLDSTIVQVAGPMMRADLGGSASVVPWLTSAYTLPFALLLLLGARCGDFAGRRRVFVVGVVIFLAASSTCAVVGSMAWLLTARVVQGVGAALIVPQTIGLIKAMFGGRELSRALGSIGPVMGLSAVLGPVLGGVLTHANLFGSSWRAVFLVNAPLSLLVLILSPLIVENRAPIKPGFDIVGVLLVTGGFGAVIYALSTIAHPSFADIGLFVLGGLLVFIFARWQRFRFVHARPSLIEVSLFSGRRFPAALVVSASLFAATTGLTLVVALHAQWGLRVDVLHTGLSLTPWAVGLGVFSWLAGSRWVPKFGNRVFFVGCAVLLLGIVLCVVAYSLPSTFPVGLLFALLIVGAGQGLFAPAFFTSALAPLRAQEIGSAAGLLNAVQQLGATVGVAVMGAVYLAVANHGGPQLAVRAALLFAAAMVIVGASAGRLMRVDAHADSRIPARQG